MIVQSIHFTFAPENADAIEAIFLELQAASRKEAGVAAFEIGRSAEKPGVFALWEVYRDDAALEAHKATDHYQRLVVGRIRTLAKDRSVEKVVLL